jgi:TPR repeat protein
VAIFNLLINDLKRNKEAFEYCLKAAERGILDAQKKLYDLYLYGHGCVRDEEKAKRWYMRTKKLEKNSNIIFDIDYFIDFEEKIKLGKELCDFEEKYLINAEGLTILERFNRMRKVLLEMFFLTDIVKNPKSCSHCGKKSPKFKCPCNNVFYCDSNCQKLNRMHHKKE